MSTFQTHDQLIDVSVKGIKPARVWAGGGGGGELKISNDQLNIFLTVNGSILHHSYMIFDHHFHLSRFSSLFF